MTTKEHVMTVRAQEKGGNPTPRSINADYSHLLNKVNEHCHDLFKFP